MVTFFEQGILVKVTESRLVSARALQLHSFAPLAQAVAPFILHFFTMTSHRKVKVSYGKGNSRNKSVQLSVISTTSYSDLDFLKNNLLLKMMKDNSIEDLGGDRNIKVGDLLIYYCDVELGSDVEYEPEGFS